MINPFIKLTGSDGYGYEAQVFLNINNISGFCIHNNKNITEIVSGDETFYITETPEEVSAMIQKYYDKKLRLGFIQSVLTGISSDSNFQNWESVSSGVVCLADMMMEKMKND